MNKTIGWTLFLLLSIGSISALANPVEQSAPAGISSATAGPFAEGQQSPMPMGETDPGQDMALRQNMDNMATTVTHMAEVCEQMMNKEMAFMPYKIAAGIGLFVLITLVLLLLVVLEVQWIMYWSRILKKTRMN